MNSVMFMFMLTVYSVSKIWIKLLLYSMNVHIKFHKKVWELLKLLNLNAYTILFLRGECPSYRSD